MTLRIASVCKSLPNPDSAASGAFVLRRLAAMSGRSDVDLEIVQPLPYFPVARPLPSWGREPSHLAGDLEVHHAPMFYLPGILKRLDGRFLARALWRVLARPGRPNRCQLIDAHFGYPDGVGAVAVAKRLGIASFVTVRGLETDYLRDPVIGPVLARALCEATGCISVSHSLRRLLLEHGVPGENVRVIPNSVDRRMFHPADRSEARASLGIAQDARLIVSVGTLINLKRHHVVIGAMPEVRRQVAGARLAIIGTEREERDYPARLDRLATDLGVADAVRIVGAVPPAGVAQWLAAADAFCLVSEREGCCNAVLEALASGRPVVASAVGDNADYVTDHDNGRIVPVDDVTATTQALTETLGRRDWDPGAISAGLAVGSWDGVAASVVEFFRERLERRACAGRSDGACA